VDRAGEVEVEVVRAGEDARDEGGRAVGRRGANRAQASAAWEWASSAGW
jgi:hypothetical protein